MNAKLIDVGTIAYVDVGIAKRIAPKLFARQDKDGLVELDKLEVLEPGVFRQGELLFFAHPYFRRSQSRFNTLNFPFLDAFWTLRHDQPKKIAIDEDLVGLASTYRRSIELSYWYGPHFKDDLYSNADNVTVHAASDADQFISGIARTEFWWYEQKGLKTFECEEVLDLPMFELGDDAYGLRFVHSILDQQSGLPTHLDGAIRQYSFEQICNRLDVNIREFGRNAVYTKLWRIDGNISVADWKTLITHYYRDNHSLADYFGGEVIGEYETPALIRSKHNHRSLIPWSIDDGQGICMLMGYANHSELENAGDRFVIPLDTITVDGLTKRYVEQEAMELKKVLKRNGQSLHIPSDSVFVAFEDLSYNFPVIEHVGENAVQLANDTMLALASLCREWSLRGDRRVLSTTCRIRYKTKTIGFSFAGTATDFDRFLMQGFSFPNLEGDVSDWCEKQSHSITNCFPKSSNYPEIDELIRLTGILQLKRQFLDPENYDVERRGSETYANFRSKNSEIVGWLRDGCVRIAPAFEIVESRCSLCSNNYRECDCSKILDEGVVQRVERSEFRGCYWTNVPATD
jgi:hypothetical protein